MDLQTLMDEFTREGIGQLLYAELQRVVRAVALGRGYPTTYSPSGRWDDDALLGLTHDWIGDKLLRRGQLKHLFLANPTVGGFRRGLELSFQDFLVGRRKRTTLDNLFGRTNAILESDPRFVCVVQAAKKAARFWGLASWDTRPVFQGPEQDLIAAGFRQRDIPLIRYSQEARKSSPIVSGPELAKFLHGLLDDVGYPLSLAHIAIVLKYRFNLVEAGDVSLDEPVGDSGDDEPLAASLPDVASVESEVLIDDAARVVILEMSARQQRALLALEQQGLTLNRIADELGCSKSTVDNELRRTMKLIRRESESVEEGREIYRRVVELLGNPYPEE